VVAESSFDGKGVFSMQISNNFSVSGVDATRAAGRSVASNPAGNAAGASGLAAPTDQLDLSPEALAVSGGETGEVFRAGRVAELRQAIAEGNYDTDAKMSEALSRMLDRLA